MKLAYSVLILAAILVVAKPTNNWNKPCFHGECAYDLTTSNGGSGALKIFGAPKAITDITPAAGWVILDCDPQALVQDIRLVCKTGDASGAGCSHMFDHGGPVNKVVRLPESCGAGPFARIASVRIASDQTIPAHAESHVFRRDGATPTVHVLSVDTNFGAVDVSETGVVHFAFVAANFPGVDGTALYNFDPVLQQRSPDGFFDWVKGAVDWVKKAAGTVAEAIKSLPEKLKKATSFKIDAKKPIPIKHSGEKVLVDKSTKCNNIDAHLKISVTGNVNLVAMIGAAGDGSIIPPTVNQLGAYVGLSGDVDAHLLLNAAVTGNVESNKLRIFELPLTPITVPGIFELGPYLNLDAKAEANLELNLDVDVALVYHIDNLEFWYPRAISKESERKISSKESPLKLSAAVDVTAKASVTGHIIPSVHLGFQAIGGKISLSAFVEADIYGKLQLTAEAHASASVGKREEESQVPRIADRAYVPPYGSQARDLTAGSAGFTGCFDILAGIVLRGGGEGKLFGIGGEKTVDFFGPKEFNIFHKCWSAGTPKKRTVSAWQPSSLERRVQSALRCKSGKVAPVGKGEKTKAHSF